MFSGGLSPLARGTPRATSATRINNRFIPAGAGNSHGIWQTSSTCTVYPRWRGELHCNPSARAISRGLSPLARGTHDIELSIYLFFRFIPAGAGNSAGNITNKINVNGLSPLARGTHAFIRRVWLRLRFIPAGAGNSAIV